MRWVEIINVMVNEDGFVLVIKDGTIVGLKYFDVDFCKNVNLEDNDSVQKLCLDILDYSDTLKYDDPSLAQLTRDCINVLLDGVSVGSWVQDRFYFNENELCV